MAYPDTGFHLVDVLAAVSAGPEGVPFDVRRTDLDVYGVVDEGIYEDGGECSLALSLGVEGGDTDEPVNSVFRFQVAICIIALDLYRGGFDAGLVSVEEVGDRHLVAVTLSPAHVHSHEHG